MHFTRGARLASVERTGVRQGMNTRYTIHDTPSEFLAFEFLESEPNMYERAIGDAISCGFPKQPWRLELCHENRWVEAILGEIVQLFLCGVDVGVL